MRQLFYDRIISAAINDRLGATNETGKCYYRLGNKCCALGIFLPKTTLKKHKICNTICVNLIQRTLEQLNWPLDPTETLDIQMLHDTCSDHETGFDKPKFLAGLDKIYNRYNENTKDT